MKMWKLLGMLSAVCLPAISAAQSVGAVQASVAAVEVSAPLDASSSVVSTPFELRNTTENSAQTATDGAGNAAEQQTRLQRNSAQSISPFQRVIRESTGQVLPVFGRDLFGGGAAFQRSVDAPVTADYVLGPGDEVIIRAWGSIDIDYRTKVDAAGQISLPRVGVFSVAGSKASDLDKALTAQLSKLYTNYSLSVSVGKLRSMKVYAVGEAKRPGVFEVQGNATFLSAVFASGGPSLNGSMRSIQLKRNGRKVAEMDVYHFLRQGHVQQDVRIASGDIIVFQPIQKQVALMGTVAKPAIYEIARGGSVSDLLTIGGNLPVNANKEVLLLERMPQSGYGGKKQVQRIQLPSQQYMTLESGDVVTVLGNTNAYGNAVTLKGNVAAPLRYPFVVGMRVSDLIPNKEALLTPAYYEKKNRLVQYEGGFEAGQRRTAAEVNRQTDDINWQHATVTRLADDLSETLLSFNLYRAVVLRDPTQNLELRAGDVITIYNQADVPVARSQQRRMVTLSGEFAAAGIYQVEPGETLRALVARVGGLTDEAYLYGSVFSRWSVRKQQQKTLRSYIDRLEKEVQLQAVDQSSMSVGNETTGAQIAFQKQLINKLSRTEPTGRINTNMPFGATLANVPDIPLEDGDTFYVPTRASTVTVTGAVYSPGSFLYTDSLDTAEYIGLAGGATPHAESKYTYVLHANGTVSTRSSLGWSDGQSIYPGDAVIVPDDLDRFAVVRGVKDWTQIFHQFAIGIAGLKVLRD